MYAISALAAGFVVDRYQHRLALILASAIALWSAATAAQSLATNFGSLLACRVVVGVMESVTSPAAYTILALGVPRRARPVANATFAVGVYWGGGMASASLLLDSQFGWRAVVLGTGIVGAVIALAVACALPTALAHAKRIACGDGTHPTAEDAGVAADTLTDQHSEIGPLLPPVEDLGNAGHSSKGLPLCAGTDPPHSPVAGGAPHSCRSHVLTRLGSHVCRVLRAPGLAAVIVASALRFVAGLSIAYFLAKYVAVQFPDEADQQLFAAGNAVIIAVCGSISALAGGALGSRMMSIAPSPSTISAVDAEAAAPARQQLYIPAVGGLVAAVAWAVLVLVPEAAGIWVVLTALAVEYLFAEAWFGPTLAFVQSAVPPADAGTAVALFVSATSIAGSLSPVVVGAIWDALEDKRDSRWPLLVAVSGSYVLSGLVFWTVIAKR